MLSVTQQHTQQYTHRALPTHTHTATERLCLFSLLIKRLVSSSHSFKLAKGVHVQEILAFLIQTPVREQQLKEILMIRNSYYNS